MKKQWLIKRTLFAIRHFPKRLIRLFSYPFTAFYFRSNGGSLYRSFPLLLADCFFIIDIYEIATNLYKKSARPLTKREILRGGEIFGNSIDFQIVMIDAQAEIMTKSRKLLYVSGNTINSWGAFPDDYLIHELVHVWQYQQFGAGYIACALKAQSSESGYNYADTEGWYLKPSILNFNAEQQGDLVQDYFRLKMGFNAQWGNCRAKDLPKYEKYIQELVS